MDCQHIVQLDLSLVQGFLTQFHALLKETWQYVELHLPQLGSSPAIAVFTKGEFATENATFLAS